MVYRPWPDFAKELVGCIFEGQRKEAFGILCNVIADLQITANTIIFNLKISSDHALINN